MNIKTKINTKLNAKKKTKVDTKKKTKVNTKMSAQAKNQLKVGYDLKKTQIVTVEDCATVKGIYYNGWTISANINVRARFNRATGKYVWDATHIGTVDGDITAVHDDRTVPVLKFSNSSKITPVQWAQKIVDTGIDLGDRGDWADAIYLSDEVSRYEQEFLRVLNGGASNVS